MLDSYASGNLTLTRAPASEMRRVDAVIGTKTIADRLESLPESFMARLFDDRPLLDRLSAMQDASDDEAHTLAYSILEDGRAIGCAAFLSYGTDAPEAQILLLPEARGKNIAFEAMSFLLAEILKEVPSVVWRTLPDNGESIALAHRLGGVKEECADELEETLFLTFRIGRADA